MRLLTTFGLYGLVKKLRANTKFGKNWWEACAALKQLAKEARMLPDSKDAKSLPDDINTLAHISNNQERLDLLYILDKYTTQSHCNEQRQAAKYSSNSQTGFATAA
jgi:hypothetical protein